MIINETHLDRCIKTDTIKSLTRDIFLHLFALKMRKVTLPFYSFTPTKWAF